MAKKATIKDVASRAGVAPSTVSYAFNGKRSISDEARKRIMDAVKILDYRPSYAAQLMKTSRTMSIGVAIDQCSNPATSRFLESLGQIMRKHGYHMILGVSGGNIEEGINIVRHFASGMVDGVINMLPGMSLLEAKQLCRDIPVVTYGRPSAESPVSIDYRSGMVELMEYLWCLGHRRIGFVTISNRKFNSLEDPCIFAAKAFLQSKGADLDERLIYFGDGTFESGMVAGMELYQHGITAMFSGNDISGAGVLAWAHANGVRIPDDLSVAGFDDSPIASSVFPTLTSVQLPNADLAEYTFKGLKNKLDGLNDWQHKKVPTSLIVRNSCKKID